jgi:phosphoribosylamine--glycine ligase
MLTNQGPKVLEFNARFGDPETQILLMRLKSDLLDALEAVVDERLESVNLEWDHRPAITVVMAAEGYPGAYDRSKVVQNLDAANAIPNVKVFHAGTTLRPDPSGGKEPRVLTDGGRVLNVTALGDTLAEAKAHAYQAARTVKFAGAWFRSDIGDKAIKAASSPAT